MNTIVERFDGVDLIRPVGDFKWPHPTFEGFPDCCGVGAADEISNIIIPETILGMRVSPVCWVHDWTYTYWPKTWAAFHFSNSIIYQNLRRVNRAKGGNFLMRALREPLMMAWYLGVNTKAGSEAFFNALPGVTK